MKKFIKQLKRRACSKWDHTDGLNEIIGAEVMVNGKSCPLKECLRCRGQFFLDENLTLMKIERLI